MPADLRHELDPKDPHSSRGERTPSSSPLTSTCVPVIHSLHTKLNKYNNFKDFQVKNEEKTIGMEYHSSKTTVTIQQVNSY